MENELLTYLEEISEFTRKDYEFLRNYIANRKSTPIEHTIPIACNAQEYQVILTQTDPRMRAQLILTGLGLLDVVSMAREGNDKPEEHHLTCFDADNTCSGDFILCDTCDTWYCERHYKIHDIRDLLEPEEILQGV